MIPMDSACAGKIEEQSNGVLHSVLHSTCISLNVERNQLGRRNFAGK
jgi:hypothetical protein